MSDLIYTIPILDENGKDVSVQTTYVNKTSHFKKNIHQQNVKYVLTISKNVLVPEYPNLCKGLNVAHNTNEFYSFVVVDVESKWSPYNILLSNDTTTFVEIELPVNDDEFGVYEDQINIEMGSPGWFYTNKVIIQK